jgi:SAM-dependent methyltransferase
MGSGRHRQERSRLNMRRSCPVCESSELETVGPILHPQPAMVAGVLLDLGDTEYRLRECRRCGFQFKDPPIAAERLMACYTQAESGNWGVDPDPWQRKFDVLCDVLEKHSTGRRVLEVGCFNGAFLNYLDGEWQKFGVEPSYQAAQLALTRGVEILAGSLDELGPDVGSFDAILAIDVVEHVVEPLPFFRQMSNLLASGGVLLILTGDNESFAWRLQNEAYWYCSLPEHISFYSKSSLDWLGAQLGMRGIECRRLCHKRLPLRRWCSDAIKSAAYVLGKKTRGLGLPALRRLFVERRGPTIQSARDHLLYVYRKM